MCEPKKTAWSLGDDTHAVVARPEHELRTECAGCDASLGHLAKATSIGTLLSKLVIRTDLPKALKPYRSGEASMPRGTTSL